MDCWIVRVTTIVLATACSNAFQARSHRWMSHPVGSRQASRLRLSVDDINWDQAEALLKQYEPSWASRADFSSGYESMTANSLRWYIPDEWRNGVSSQEWFLSLLATATNVEQFYAALPLWLQVTSVGIPLLTITLMSLYSWSFPPDAYRSRLEPYVRGRYDPIQARAYYRRHLFVVLQRCLQLLRLSNRFLLNVAWDRYITKREEENRSERAEELLQLITKLGPTAIKVGQALSVRPDLIPYEYANALATLQDQVPPFDGTAAREVLIQELGPDRLARLRVDTFKGPVASASIGQVYKADIDGKSVAVKVQRPNVLADIALDLFIVREFAPIYQKITGGATNLQLLANEWGRGFIAELDYRTEAENTMRFNREMQKRNLNAVCAPTVIPEFSTEQILVTEWVDGTRLDQSDADDVPRLCAVALNAYLVMLLELQSLHCDPHPGNLLRTTDGRLCILDFGMTLDIDPNLQYSLLEYVAHLTSEDYDELPDDLVKLGFLKAEKLDFARRSGVLEPLKYFLKQAGKGGGAQGVRDRIFEEYREKYPGLDDEQLRVEMRAEMKEQMKQIVERESVSTGITLEVEELQRQNRDSFMIPEWFLYTSRAFLTLEGVSLQADENYSIIKSCFPYIAKRLVADDDPRARKALRDLLYGAGDMIDVNRLSELADGFTSYTTTTKTINQQAKANQSSQLVLAQGPKNSITKQDSVRKGRLVAAESTITLVKDSADVLLSPEGNLVQSLLLEETALAASARFKDTVRSTLVEGPQLFRDSLPLGLGSLLPPLPFEDQVKPFVQKSHAEIKAQQLADKLSDLIASRSMRSGEATEPRMEFVQNLRELEPEQAALVLKEMRENLPRYAPLVGRLGTKFVSKLLETANVNIEKTLSELELTGKSPDPAFRATVKGLSTAASRGASVLNAEPDVAAKNQRLW